VGWGGGGGGEGGGGGGGMGGYPFVNNTAFHQLASNTPSTFSYHHTDPDTMLTKSIVWLHLHRELLWTCSWCGHRWSADRLAVSVWQTRCRHAACSFRPWSAPCPCVGRTCWGYLSARSLSPPGSSPGRWLCVAHMCECLHMHDRWREFVLTYDILSQNSSPSPKK